MVHKNLRKSHMKNLKVCIASSALVAALALAPAFALAEGTAPAPTNTTGATATTGVTPIPAPTREQLMDPTNNPYAPEEAYFLPDITNPIPDGFMVGNADGETIIDNGDGTVTVKGHWVTAEPFDEVISVYFVRIPDPAPNPDPTPTPTPRSNSNSNPRSNSSTRARACTSTCTNTSEEVRTSCNWYCRCCSSSFCTCCKRSWFCCFFS